ncbi:MAG TPA: UPF0182 family protein [Gemmatimonadaceae bacterium]|nr:UPF0182 family protein [Gemmatimonadaceae bacterium]
MRARRGVILAVAVIALLLLAGRAVAGMYAEQQWYAALGVPGVWRHEAMLAGVLRGVSGLLGALFVFANLYAVRHSVVSLVLPRRVANIEIGEEVPGRYLVGAAAVLSVLLGAVLAIPGSRWPTLALAHGGVPFGETDPYFEADLGFFVYWLPFEHMLYVWALIAVLAAAAVVVFLYALTPSLRWERGTLYVSQYVRRHLVALGALMLVILAWSYRLDAYRVLMDGSGPAGAFTFSDHRAAIPVNLWLSILTVAAAFVVLFFGWSGQIRVAFVTVTLELVLTVVLRQGAPVVARQFAEVRDPDVREEPYRALRADYTRRAYALDRVTAGDSVTLPGAAAAMASLPAWDPAAIERSLTRLHRTNGVVRGIGWSTSRDGLVAVVVDGPGEGIGDGERAGPAPEAWSVTRLRAAEADARGDPVRVAAPAAVERAEQSLPPVLVYDSVPGYAVLSDSLGRVAAPELGSTLSRLAFAWSLQNFRLLSTDVARRGARILTHRGVRERVRQLVPFFEQGSVVTPIVAADSLYWAMDVYAASADYPLSEHIPLGDRDCSYLHHAGAAVVNAHTGRVSILLDVDPGPIAESWRRRFPSLFAPGALPAEVAASLPPALDAARAQAAVIAGYGLRGERPRNGHLPWNAGADSVLREDAPALVSLRSGVLGWTQPVLDSTDRVVGLVVASGGRTSETHWLPLTSPGGRWNTLVEDLRRAIDSTTAAPRDGRLVHGAVRVAPLAGGPLLAQSAYVWRQDAAPSLARVAVAVDTTVRTGHDLAEALGVSPPPGDTLAATPRDFRERVAALYDAMRAALQRGDWTAFGRAWDALGRLLARERH